MEKVIQLLESRIETINAVIKSFKLVQSKSTSRVEQLEIEDEITEYETEKNQMEKAIFRLSR